MIGWIRTLHILSIILGIVFFKTVIVVYGTITGFILLGLGLILVGIGAYGFISIHVRKESIRKAEAEAESKPRRSDEVE